MGVKGDVEPARGSRRLLVRLKGKKLIGGGQGGRGAVIIEGRVGAVGRLHAMNERWEGNDKSGKTAKRSGRGITQNSCSDRANVKRCERRRL